MRKLIKISGPVRSWYRADCSSCYQVNQCISAGALRYSKKDYARYVHGIREETEAMRKGKELHEEVLQIYPQVEDIGIEKISSTIFKGGRIALSEVGICSKFYGLRGKVDFLGFISDTENIKIDIIEFKTRRWKTDYLQLACYCLILSDPNFEIIYRRKGKNVGAKIMPKIPIKLSIEGRLHAILTGKEYSKFWMKDNKLTKWGAGISAMIQKKAKILRKLHKYSLVLAEEWDDEIKHRQRFLGKRSILRLTKPIVKK